MNSLRCSNCSLVNFATAEACKRCGMPFDSAGDVETPQYDQFASSPQPGAGGSYFWDQPAYQVNYAPAPEPQSRGGSKIIAILVAVAVVGLVAFVAIPKLLKKNSEFGNVSWVEYKSSDGKYSVSLPAQPKETTATVPSPFGNAKAHVLEAAASKNGGCMLMYAEYPSVNLNVSEDTIYDMAIAGATKRQTAMKIGARRFVTQGGFRGVEVELSPANSKMDATGAIRIFWVSPRMYVLGAGGPNTEDFKAVQAKCFDSFRVLSAN